MKLTLAQINQFWEKNSNHEFLFDGNDWWPLVKTAVGFQLFLIQSKGTKVLTDINGEGSVYAPPLTIRDAVSLFKSVIKGNKTNAKTLVVTSSSHNTTPYNGILMNQFTEPFLELFEKNSFSYEIYDLVGKNNSINTATFKKYYKLIAVRKFNKDVKIQGSINEFCEKLKLFFGEEFKFHSFISYLIINCWSEYKSFEWWLQRSKFEKILCYCYYNSSVFPIILAANKRGITTVEYQHSQVSSEHLAYSSWKESEDVDFFPKIFWAWRKSDVERIQKEFSFKRTHKSLLGGNVFISKYLNKCDLSEKSGISVLLTLQGIGIPDYIYEYIKCSRDVFWHLRLHPRQLSDKELIVKLKELNPNHVDIEDSNNLSLYDLLGKVDYHMTSYSGSALEAQTFGVQNIIYSDKGYSSYKELIESNCYFFIEKKDELDKILREKLLLDNKKDEVLVDQKKINQTFVETFGN